MTLFRAVQAAAGSEGNGPVDWDAAGEVAKAAIDPGELSLTDAEQQGYADDVRAARSRIRDVAEVDFDVPGTVEIQNRHHWIDANTPTFQRVMDPVVEELGGSVPGVARSFNTATTGGMLAFLGNNVLGQYDPLLLAEEPHALYFVHPNIEKVADTLGVERDRFRRWIAFHEVTHAAEFGAAPWLTDYLETQLLAAIDSLTDGHLERDAFREVNVAMTAVEGYAELVMDRAFDDEYDDLRRKLDERRGGTTPMGKLVRRLLGMGMKREQYERGKAFFDAVADERGVHGASIVWESAEYLPSDDELDNPDAWLARVPK